jgi:hypothetical protein
MNESPTEKSFLQLFLSKEKRGGGLDCAPSMQDSAYSKLLSCVIRSFGTEETDNEQKLEVFFSAHPEVRTWVDKNLSSVEGQRKLKSLIGLELG